MKILNEKKEGISAIKKSIELLTKNVNSQNSNYYREWSEVLELIESFKCFKNSTNQALGYSISIRQYIILIKM